MKTLNAVRTALALALALLVCSGTAQSAPLNSAGKRPGRISSAAKSKSTQPAAPAKSDNPSATEPAKTDLKPKDETATTNLAGFKAGSEPEGFRNFKWGAAYSDFSDLKDDNADGEINGRKVKNYKKANEDSAFAGIRADEICYVFSDDKFYGVGIDYKKVDDARWDDITKALLDQYGRVPELRVGNQPAYVWWGDKSFVRVKRYDGWCYLDIWSKFFFGDSNDKAGLFTRAIDLGDMPQLKKMIEADAALVKSTDDEGKSALFWSLDCHPKDGAEQIIEYLISKSADVNQKAKDGSAPLHRACELGELSMVKLLVSKGADVNAKNSDGYTPLLAAYDHTDVAEFLISKDADVKAKETKYGMTALHHAAEAGATELVKLLISKGVDVNAKDNDGYTPLYLAAERRDNTDAMAALIQSGADVNIRESKDGQSILENAVEWGYTDVAKLLISKGADVNAKDNDGHSPLHYAVRDSGKTEITKALIDAGADLNAKERKYGQTPLHIAIDEHNDEAVMLLLDKGADVNAKDDKGNTTLQYAIDDQEDKIADLIRQHGGTQ